MEVNAPINNMEFSQLNILISLTGYKNVIENFEKIIDRCVRLE